jgi:hypothetical protein
MREILTIKSGSGMARGIGNSTGVVKIRGRNWLADFIGKASCRVLGRDPLNDIVTSTEGDRVLSGRY